MSSGFSEKQLLLKNKYSIYVPQHSIILTISCFISISVITPTERMSSLMLCGATACVYVARWIDVYWIGIVCDIEVVVRTLCASIWPANFNSHLSCAPHTHIYTYTLAHKHLHTTASRPVFFARSSAISSLSIHIFLHIPIRYWILHCFVHKFWVLEAAEEAEKIEYPQIRICAKWIFAPKTWIRLCFCSSTYATGS